MFLTAKTPPSISGVALIQARQDLNPQPFVLETNALPIELLAYKSRESPPCSIKLLCLAVRCMLPATRAILAEFQTIRIVTAILFGRVISLLAIIALQCNDRANILFLRSHAYLPTFSIYSSILVTTPAPTVRPPARMANLEPCSRATGTISSTVRLTSSPGITISTPSGRVMLPVTSIVRM